MTHNKFGSTTKTTASRKRFSHLTSQALHSKLFTINNSHSLIALRVTCRTVWIRLVAWVVQILQSLLLHRLELSITLYNRHRVALSRAFRFLLSGHFMTRWCLRTWVRISCSRGMNPSVETVRREGGAVGSRTIPAPKLVAYLYIIEVIILPLTN